MSQTQTKTLKVDTIIELNQAVELVNDNKYLDGVTSFKVGMLGEYTKGVVKSYTKERDKIIQEARRKQKTLQDSLKVNDTEDNKAFVSQQMTELNEESQEKLNALIEKEEEIKIPHLKLSEFIAKADISDVFPGKDGVLELKVVVKAGQSLVPVKFFTLTGSIIHDDKNS